MSSKSIPIFILFQFLSFHTTFAQNITGIWEGLMSDEFLRVNINQYKNEICGYTYDIVLDNKRSRCKSYFSGKYDPQKGIWTINGINFIENSGDHILMTLRLWQVDPKNTKLLRGMVSSAPGLLNFFDNDGADLFWLKKVSNRPVPPKKGMPICYQQTNATSKTIPSAKNNSSKKLPLKPTNDIDAKIAINKQEQPIDSVSVKSIPSSIDNKEALANDGNDKYVLSLARTRKNNSISDILVQVKKIKIEIYDNGSIDNDSVSILYNGKLLKTNERLTETPITLELTLDTSKEKHELLLFAENVGIYPPNTALIVVTAGKKRYELHSSASLTENAILNIIYQP